MFRLTGEESTAKRWALTAGYQSVAAQYARLAAEALDRAQNEIEANKIMIADMARAMEKHELIPEGYRHGVANGRKCATCGMESFDDSPAEDKHKTDCRYAYLLRQAKEVAR